MNINRKTDKVYGLGFVAYEKLVKSKKQELLSITFTKGKLELEVKDIEIINCYDDSLNIILKDKSVTFVNLNNVTQMV